MKFDSVNDQFKPDTVAMFCYVLPILMMFIGGCSGGNLIIVLFTIILSGSFQLFLINSTTYQKNLLIRFHAYQSIFLVVGYYFCNLLLVGLIFLLGFGKFNFFDQSIWGKLEFVGFAWLFLTLGYLGLNIFLAIKCSQKKIYRLPYIGDWAMQRVSMQANNNFVPTSSIISQTQPASILQPIQPPFPKPRQITENLLDDESDNSVQTDTAKTLEHNIPEMSSIDSNVGSFNGMSREAKIIFGFMLGGIFFVSAAIIFSSSASDKEKIDRNTYTSNPPGLDYNINSSNINSTTSYYPTKPDIESSTIGQQRQSKFAIDSKSTSANPSSIFSSLRKGHLVTDSNLRDAPNKDCYSVGIQFKDAKVEVLDETSYEVNGKVSVWYKVHVTEYGCSKDSNLGCGKNSSNDSDEGWVNAKAVLITNGNNSISDEQKINSQPNITKSNYSVRIYNVDDLAMIYVNGSKAMETPYFQTQSIDITNLFHPGKNEVRFVLKNLLGGFAYGFELYQDGTSIFKDECGVAGKYGCKGKSQTGLVYDRTVTINVD